MELTEEQMEQARIIAWRTVRKFGFQSVVFNYEDCYQDACLGLLQAMDRYDPDRNVQFNTFAERRIYGAVVDAMRNNDQFHRGRHVNIRDYINVISLEDVPRCEFPDSRSPPDVLFYRDECKRIMLKVASKLGRKYKRCFELYCRGFTMKEIGKKIGVNESRTSQMLTAVKIGTKNYVAGNKVLQRSMNSRKRNGKKSNGK